MLKPDDKTKIVDDARQLGDRAGFETAYGLDNLVPKLIEAFLGLLGIIFIILIILAGYNWMSAGGDEVKVTKAKETLSRAIIGLFIIIAAYAITVFIFEALPAGTGGNGGTTVI